MPKHETSLPLDELLMIAAARGRADGYTRRRDFLLFGYHADELPEWSPLSGEWAGESIQELIGDLLDAVGHGPHAWDDEPAICDAYENAALNAYYGEGD